MKKTIRDFDLFGKKVIIRCDFNVPIKDGKIVDDNRIVASLDTIKYAINNGARVILMSHLGRIKSLEDKSKNSLKIVADRLSEMLGKNVLFVSETRGEILENAVASLENGDVLLMENTRFEDYPDKLESNCDEQLGKYWASLGDIFINDAFGTCHRKHASNVGIASCLPSGLGFLVENEYNNLSVLKEDIHPFVVILGGSKVSDKIGVIKNLVLKADKIIIGGGMAFTFLKALGYNIGKSVLDEESISFCKEILEKYKEKIVLPVDFASSREFSNDTESYPRKIGEFKDDDMGLDIGPLSISLFKSELENAKMIFWNGPLGVYEFEKYREGSKQVLEFLCTLDCTLVLGGGDIVACASNLGFKDKVTFASTGGGVTLEFMEGKELPGIVSVQDK